MSNKTQEKTKIEVRAVYLGKSVPEKRKQMFVKAFDGTCSPRQAIKANCFACANFEIEEARNCQVLICPLYEYNPYRLAVIKKQGAADENAEEE